MAFGLAGQTAAIASAHAAAREYREAQDCERGVHPYGCGCNDDEGFEPSDYEEPAE